MYNPAFLLNFCTINYKGLLRREIKHVFLVSAEQFKKAFEEENLNEQFMNDLLSYLKTSLYQTSKENV